MNEKCNILKKYVEMVWNVKNKEEALEVVSKIILDAIHSKEIQDAAFDYVNKRLECAALNDDICEKI